VIADLSIAAAPELSFEMWMGAAKERFNDWPVNMAKSRHRRKPMKKTESGWNLDEELEQKLYSSRTYYV